jgi:hypothetical protein
MHQYSSLPDGTEKINHSTLRLHNTEGSKQCSARNLAPAGWMPQLHLLANLLVLWSRPIRGAELATSSKNATSRNTGSTASFGRQIHAAAPGVDCLRICNPFHCGSHWSIPSTTCPSLGRPQGLTWARDEADTNCFLFFKPTVRAALLPDPAA